MTIRAFGVLAAILDVAVRDRRISTNPARGVKLPRKTPKRRAYLTARQVELLAASAGEESTLILTLAYTGLRWGEAIALRVSSVDSLRRRLLVEENAVTVGATIHVGSPKTHERRSVPFPRFLSEPIAHECEGKSRDGLLFGRADSHTWPSRTQIMAGSVVRSWARELSIPASPTSLRTSFATLP